MLVTAAKAARRQDTTWAEREMGDLGSSAVHLNQPGGPGRNGFQDEVEAIEAGEVEPRGEDLRGMVHRSIADATKDGEGPALIAGGHDLHADAGEHLTPPTEHGTVSLRAGHRPLDADGGAPTAEE
jgi:hypothetical protein